MKIKCLICDRFFNRVPSQCELKRRFCSRKCFHTDRSQRISDNYHQIIQKKIKDRSIVDSNGCWNWQGGFGKSGGYPGISYKDRTLRGNRVAFTVFKGKIPRGKIVRHMCDNRKCLNPDHLLLGTCQDNTNDRIKRKRQIRGTQINLAKMNEEKVLKIRELSNRGTSRQQLMKLFEIGYSALVQIIKRRTWTHI